MEIVRVRALTRNPGKVNRERQRVLLESYDWIQKSGEAKKVDKIGKESGDVEYINHVEDAAGKAVWDSELRD